MILSVLMILPAFVTATLTAFLCGIFLEFGYVNFFVVWAAIVAGDLISNIFWYTIGLIGGRAFLITFGKIFGITQDHLNSTMSVFDKFKDYVAFFVSAPVGMAIMIISLMNAGIQKRGFWKYLISNTLVSVVWVWLMLTLGYFFGYAYVTYISLTERVITTIVLLVVLFGLLTLGAWIRTLLVSSVTKKL